MFFKFNGIQLGGDSKYYLQSPISGLDTAPIRLGAGDWAGQDGGYVSAQFYSMREIVITGFYIGRSCEEAADLRSALIDALPLRQSIPLFITAFNGGVYFTQSFVKDVKADITHSKSGEYQITLVSPDPFLYDAGDGVNPDSGWNELVVYKLIGGGYVTEYDMPVQWTPGTTPTIATNAGDVTVYPQFKIVGKVQNPRITNYTNNSFLQVDVTTTSDTDEIIIDMNQRTITLNGGNILSYRTSDSNWWGLNVGNSKIEFTSDGVEDVEFGILRWRTAYRGV